MKKYTTILLYFTLFTFFTAIVYAQKPLPTIEEKSKMPHPQAVKIAQDYLIKQYKEWSLTEEDVKNHFVQDFYHTEHNGLTHVYLMQLHQGIEVYNGIININVLPNGEVLYAGNRFFPNLAKSVNSTQPSFTPEDAIMAACKHLELDTKASLLVKEKKSAYEYVFDKSDFSQSDINVKLKYLPLSNKEVRLAWDLDIEKLDDSDHWSIRVDALTGKILDKVSWTSRCALHPDQYKHHDDCVDAHPLSIGVLMDSMEVKNETFVPAAIDAMSVGGGEYRVFALPTEAPSFGNRTLVTDPADATASKFGWHDNNGIAGADFTITRGNNVHAYTDQKNTNVSSLDEPNGGTALKFDNYFDPNGEPDTNRHAAVVNLFYTTNMMHDISFLYGFNEAAGNFQQRNYTGAAGANDYIRAEAQDGYKAATPLVDNASFSNAPDGSAAKILMYVWTRQEKLVNVLAPESVAGSYASGTANFGGQITATPIAGEVVIATDGTAQGTLICNPVTNTNLQGKIALIDRGICFFSDKALKVQEKGAIAAIICNVDDKLNFIMSGSTTGPNVTIPVISMRKIDCDRIRIHANNGLRISLNTPTTKVGPDFIDGDFDNGVIAHEYTHGISGRLTGGRLNVGCLNTGEHADGEGWSDFLALAVTAKPTDKRDIGRGMGTYLFRQPTNSDGIRRYKYTTDMKINPLTYDNIFINPEVHDVGEVWTAVLWDLYWNLVDKYGFDANLKNTDSGNGKAIKLVMDGMKIHPCNPGFLDARDAILAADKANFNGDNQCMIWETFARRGMGFDAKQGLASSKFDNTEGFENLPQCIKQLKITKSATEAVKAGDAIIYTIRVSNHKGIAASGVIVTDAIPTGVTYINGSANRAVTVSNGVLTWNIGDMKNDTTLILTYRANTDPNKKSIAQFIDDMEKGPDKWDGESLINKPNIWQLQDIEYRSGKNAFGVTYPTTDGASDQVLKVFNAVKVTGTQPVLRFYHKYDTEPYSDGGVVQITTNNGTTWENVDDKIFRNAYRGVAEYGRFSSIPNAKAFWGKVDSFVGTYVDLKEYLGKDIKLRFRFANDSLVSANGWFVDDVAVMDMVNYNSKARVISAQKDTAFAEVPGRGTAIDPTTTPSSIKDDKYDLQVKIYPNPTQDLLNINLIDSEATKADIQIYSPDGRTMWQNKVSLLGAKEEIVPVYTGSFPSGIYFVKISTDKKVALEKIIKH